MFIPIDKCIHCCLSVKWTSTCEDNTIILFVFIIHCIQLCMLAMCVYTKVKLVFDNFILEFNTFWSHLLPMTFSACPSPSTLCLWIPHPTFISFLRFCIFFWHTEFNLGCSQVYECGTIHCSQSNSMVSTSLKSMNFCSPKVIESPKFPLEDW